MALPGRRFSATAACIALVRRSIVPACGLLLVVAGYAAWPPDPVRDSPAATDRPHSEAPRDLTTARLRPTIDEVAIGWSSNPPPDRPWGDLAPLVSDPEPAIRGWAVRRMADADGHDAFARALAALDDESPLVRKEALETLGQHGDPAVTAVRRLLEREPNGEVRAAALRVLADVGGVSGLDLVLALTRDADLQVRVAAVQTLGHLDTGAARDALVRLAREGEPAVRLSALTTLALYVRDAPAVSALRLGRHDGDEAVRGAAAALLEDLERDTSR